MTDNTFTFVYNIKKLFNIICIQLTILHKKATLLMDSENKIITHFIRLYNKTILLK